MVSGMTDAELIDALGGPSAIAKRLPDVNAGAVTMWRKRGVPSRYWPAMGVLASEAKAEWRPQAPAPVIAPAPQPQDAA